MKPPLVPAYSMRTPSGRCHAFNSGGVVQFAGPFDHFVQPLDTGIGHAQVDGGKRSKRHLLQFGGFVNDWDRWRGRFRFWQIRASWAWEFRRKAEQRSGAQHEDLLLSTLAQLACGL